MGLAAVRLPPRPLAGLVLRRLVYASLLSALLLAVACTALFVTSAPAAISLLVEPFSLLLVPGLLMAVAVTGSHADVSASVILGTSATFYFCLFYIVLSRFQTRSQPRSR